MRKIISILLALGMVLGLSLMATPVSANVSAITVAVAPGCACQIAQYTIGFNITADLHSGTHSISIEFPAGTTVPATYATGDITVNTVAVFGSEVSVAGNTVTFKVPLSIVAPGLVTVVFTTAADIKNPCTAGSYKLKVSTSRAPDSTPVQSPAYPIQPAISTYEFVVDFGNTYPGIAVDFVPPFKACGQNDTAIINTVYNSSIPGWLDAFNVTLKSDVVGCAVPCANASVWFELTACPEDEIVSLQFNGIWYTLTSDNLTTEVGEYDALTDFVVDPALVLAMTFTVTYDAQLHFSSVGSYEICFYAECPAVAGCDPEASDIIAERCLDFAVHQWKDAGKIILDEKWNLISLPLVPFDGTLGVLQASLTPEALADWVSIWYYKPQTQAWENPTILADGKSYWVRMSYPITGNYTWWVWGTARAMPPAAPSAYPMTAAAWNMFGFTSLTDMTLNAYLWNFTTLPLVYGWYNSGDWATSGWQVKTGLSMLNSGQGYWGFFPTGGIVVPP